MNQEARRAGYPAGPEPDFPEVADRAPDVAPVQMDEHMRDDTLEPPLEDVELAEMRAEPRREIRRQVRGPPLPILRLAWLETEDSRAEVKVSPLEAEDLATTPAQRMTDADGQGVGLS